MYCIQNCLRQHQPPGEKEQLKYALADITELEKTTQDLFDRVWEARDKDRTELNYDLLKYLALSEQTLGFVRQVIEGEQKNE